MVYHHLIDTFLSCKLVYTFVLFIKGNEINAIQLQNQLRYSEGHVSILTISNVTENFSVRCQVKDPIKSGEFYSSSSAHFQVIGKLYISSLLNK